MASPKMIELQKWKNDAHAKWQRGRVIVEKGPSQRHAHKWMQQAMEVKNANHG